jgi:CBS domain-containing protein
MSSSFWIPTPLQEIEKRVDAGEAPEVTVREFLKWFMQERRGWRVVNNIRRALKKCDLTTVPDFEGEYIDAQISFRRPEKKPASAGIDTGGSTTAPSPPSHIQDSAMSAQELPVSVSAQLADPAHRISRLPSANSEPVSVQPGATVAQAVTLMLRHDYSQLPVMQSSREVKGLISWSSLGARLAIGRACEFVRDCMDKHREISSDDSLFDAIRIIAEEDCVLVRAPDKTICGIVTAYDISTQFQQLTEPFLLLGDIENHIRYLIGKTFTLEDLQHAKDADDVERKVEDVSDLTFGEYVRLLQNDSNWTKLGMKICRKTFIDWLERVREIRNDVMHFDPDPIESADLRLLKDFASFLQRLQLLAA